MTWVRGRGRGDRRLRRTGDEHSSYCRRVDGGGRRTIRLAIRTAIVTSMRGWCTAIRIISASIIGIGTDDAGGRRSEPIAPVRDWR
ncbi:MAG: hypothetical protein ACREEA_09095 [Stellaceae bacterium]